MDNDAERVKKQKLLEKMRRARGYMPPAWAYMVENDVDFMEAYDNLYERTLADGRALPARFREFVAIGILAFRGQDDAVYLHIKRARRLGATRQELLEAIEAMLAPGGSPAFGAALDAFMKVEEEEGEAGQAGGSG
jgi:alkylhydroperoxidase/carboxymuconolactone decarboxylase family protein YurZ